MNENKARFENWYRLRGVQIAGAATFAMVLGLGIGASATADESAELQAADLQSELQAAQAELEETNSVLAETIVELDEAEQSLADSPAPEDNERLEERVAELEAAQELLVDEIEEQSAAFESREKELDARETELEVRESSLEERESDTSVPEPEPEPEPQGGCSAGQVDINAAGLQELQRIYQVGPERAQQIIDLRPFASVDSLTRVSGIGDGHLGGIKNEGLACVN